MENEDNVTICAVLDGPDNGTAVNITVAFELVNNTAVRGILNLIVDTCSKV